MDDPFTRRERQVLDAMYEGYDTAKELARHLRISIRTAEKHQYNMREKVGVRSKSALLCYAIRNGWLSPTNGDG